MVLDLVSRKGFGIDEISKVNNSVVEAWILSHINSSTLKQKNEDLNKQNNGSSNFLNIYTWGSISLILLSILLILKIRKLLQSSRI